MPEPWGIGTKASRVSRAAVGMGGQAYARGDRGGRRRDAAPAYHFACGIARSRTRPRKTMQRDAARVLHPTEPGESPATGPAERGHLAPLERPCSVLFDIPVELAEPAEMLRTITGWVGKGGRHRVMYVNAHVVNQSRALPELAAALSSADLVYCDGYGVRLAARTLDLPVPHRMTGADWVWGLATLCEAQDTSLYLLGDDPPLARAAADALTRWYPRLRIVGSHHGYAEPGSPQDERALEDINASGADIVLVGMGTPKQELWVDRY